MSDIKDVESPFIEDDSIYNKNTRAVPTPRVEIGADTDDQLFSQIIHAQLDNTLDATSIDDFGGAARNRDTLYELLDSMAEDPIISAILKIFAEDSTEPNDNGKIVWVESSDSNVAQYVQFLLDSMNIDKNAYKWVHSLCKYGDLYLRLFHESEYQDDLFEDKSDKKKKLNEAIKIKAFDQDDNYVNYIEMVPNPAEMFELTKFGKTYGFIQAKTTSSKKTDNDLNMSQFRYSFKKNDVNIFTSTDFVHASLEDDAPRYPEEICISTDNDNDSSSNYTYTVKKGQSLLQPAFKIWRELMLLENAVMLNRITKSSIVRLISVEVGDMPREKVQSHLLGIKQLIEQKSALKENQSLNEYTNPGPIENNVYIPTRNGQGAITTTQIGGDVDVRGLADLDYFKNMYFAAFGIPKQFLNDTDDAAGFSGGQSLSIISSRYAKSVKRIQSTFIQAITDVINIRLIDKGLTSYINKFEIRMQSPTTQEDIDRRDNTASKVQIASDIMNLTGDIEDSTTKLKILKSLLSNVLNDSEVVQLIQDEIDKIELSNETSDNEDFSEGETDEGTEDISSSEPLNLNSDSGDSLDNTGSDTTSEPMETDGTSEESASTENNETILPNPADIDIDFTQNT